MRTRDRAGFTIVEAIVATAMMGVAGGLLAATLTVVTAARRRAMLDARGAQALRARVTWLAARPCTLPDTAGVERMADATESWSARRSVAGWDLVDSVFVQGAPPRAAERGTVRCP